MVLNDEKKLYINTKIAYELLFLLIKFCERLSRECSFKKIRNTVTKTSRMVS